MVTASAQPEARVLCVIIHNSKGRSAQPTNADRADFTRTEPHEADSPAPDKLCAIRQTGGLQWYSGVAVRSSAKTLQFPSHLTQQLPDM